MLQTKRRFRESKLSGKTVRQQQGTPKIPLLGTPRYALASYHQGCRPTLIQGRYPSERHIVVKVRLCLFDWRWLGYWLGGFFWLEAEWHELLAAGWCLEPCAHPHFGSVNHCRAVVVGMVVWLLFVVLEKWAWVVALFVCHLIHSLIKKYWAKVLPFSVLSTVLIGTPRRRSVWMTAASLKHPYFSSASNGVMDLRFRWVKIASICVFIVTLLVCFVTF